MVRYIVLLFSVLLLATGTPLQAQIPPGKAYFTKSDGSVVSILPDGNVYKSEMAVTPGPPALEPTILAGNVWEEVLGWPPDPYHIGYDNDMIVAILPGGDTYMTRITVDDTLAATLLIGNFWDDVMGTPPDPYYFIHDNGLIVAISPGGDAYKAEIITDTLVLGPTDFVGNFWEGVMGVPPDPIYFVHEDGTIVAVGSNGDTYRGAISGSELTQTAYMGNIWEGFSILIDPHHILNDNSLIVAILADGDTYKSEITIEGGLTPTVNIGNFWEGVMSIPPDPVYTAHDNGLIVAIGSNGAVYQGWISDDLLQPTAYVGDFWEGVVATEKASWGDIKKLFK